MMLDYNFYNCNAIDLAKKLLGHIIVRKTNNGEMAYRIVETEAYYGPLDKASHAYNNKKTNRTKVMYKKGGFSYIYLIYGMYNCLNIVSGKEGNPEAVLIRAAEPIRGIDQMINNRNIKIKNKYKLTNGPGKLCDAMNIDRCLNNLDLANNDIMYIEEGNLNNFKIIRDKRINIDYAQEYADKLWRFYIDGNKYVSKRRG